MNGKEEKKGKNIAKKEPEKIEYPNPLEEITGFLDIWDNDPIFGLMPRFRWNPFAMGIRAAGELEKMIGWEVTREDNNYIMKRPLPPYTRQSDLKLRYDKANNSLTIYMERKIERKNLLWESHNSYTVPLMDGIDTKKLTATIEGKELVVKAPILEDYLKKEEERKAAGPVNIPIEFK